MRISWISLFVVACHQPLWTPPQPTPGPLPSNDRRRDLVGTWTIEFRLDSIDRRPASDSTARAGGTLSFRDTIIQNGQDGLKGTVSLDFTPLLGRQISCFTAGEGIFPISYRGDSVSLSLTPGVADCGLWMIGKQRGDTIAGRWVEDGFACCPSVGRFVMRKTH